MKKFRICLSALLIASFFFIVSDIPFTRAATPAFVQKATAGTASTPVSVSPSWSSPTTAGNLLVAVFSCRSPGQGNTASTVVPPAGMGWTSITSNSTNYGNGGGRNYMEMFYIANAASQSGGQTWTSSNCGFMGSTNLVVSMIEYSGIDTSSPLDVSASHVSPNDAGASAPFTTETTATTGTTSATAQGNELAVAALATNAAQTDPSGYTERLDGGVITVGHYLEIADKTLTVTGTQSASTTYTPAAVNVGIIATFKYTVAGVAAAPVRTPKVILIN